MMTSPPVANSAIVFAPTLIANNARLTYNKKVLTGLGIVEVIIGSLAIVFNCILFGSISDVPLYRSSSNNGYNNYYRNNHYYSSYCFTTGEGIWCGVWILIGGALGIASGRKRSTPCLINCHMGFSIVGAIVSSVLFSMGILAAVINRSTLATSLDSFLAFGGFVTFILFIVSAAYCCKTSSSAGLNTCCGTCCVEEQVNQVGVGQAMYVANPNQQVQQTVVQTYSPNRTGQQGSYPGNIVTVVQPGVVTGQQPVFVAQQQPANVAQQSERVARQPSAVVVQQFPSSSSDPWQRSQAEHQQQETWKAADNVATSVARRDSPPSYFQDA